MLPFNTPTPESSQQGSIKCDVILSCALLAISCIVGCGADIESDEQSGVANDVEARRSKEEDNRTAEIENESGRQTSKPSSAETTSERGNSDVAQPQDGTEANGISSVPFDEVAALTVTAARSRFNAKEFPAPAKAPPSSSSTATRTDFMLPVGLEDAGTQLVDAFAGLDWETISKVELTKEHVTFYMRTGELLVSCTLQSEASTRTRMYMEVLGNIDIRSIPKFSVEDEIHDHLDNCIYQSNGSLDEVMAHYRGVLNDADWQAFKPFDGTFDQGDNRRSASYRQNGVRLNVTAFENSGQVLVSLFCGMLEQDIPTPVGVTGLELGDGQLQQRFTSDQSVSELAEFYSKEMKQIGWTLPFGKQFGDSVAGMMFTRPDGDPVYLELRELENGRTVAYMSAPTRQVLRATEGEFEVEYKDGLSIGESKFHSLDYTAIPFHEPLDEGCGRSIAESVFYETELSIDDTCEFYRKYFTGLGWEALNRLDDESADALVSSTLIFEMDDAQVMVTARNWREGTNRITIEGNGIQFPGSAFCHMMARPEEADDIE